MPPQFGTYKMGIISGITLLLLTLFGIKSVNLLRWRHLKHRQLTTLVLLPPAHTVRTAAATQELFSVVHGLMHGRRRSDKLFRRPIVLNYEIVSSYEHGIEFRITTETKLVTSVQQIITSYMPAVKVSQRPHVPAPPSLSVSFRQSCHYAFPLAETIERDQHDPLAYVNGAMANLNPKEEVRLQLIVTPVRLKEASSLAHRILRNEDLLSHLTQRRQVLFKILEAVNRLLLGVTQVVCDINHGSSKQSQQNHVQSNNQHAQIAKHMRPARTLSAFELELMEAIHRKVNQPLFRVSLRAGVVAADKATTLGRLQALKSALGSYDMSNYQSLRTKPNWPLLNRLLSYAYQFGLPDFTPAQQMVLSAAELASLYHFPLGTNVQTDNLQIALSHSLPAAISLKQDKQLGIILGQNSHHGTRTLIGLTDQERERHVFVVGGTGNGKTTLLQYAIVQDMNAGKGIAIIDPHGDMAEKLLEYVPEHRIKDVIYFNPNDLEYPIGLNLLEIDHTLTGKDLLREKDLVTESVISVFRKIFSDEDSAGHRIEYILRNAIQTALTLPDATLFTIFNLLNDAKFRRKAIKTLENQDLKNFWLQEMGQAGDMQRVKMAAGITAKIGRFLFSASAKSILEQPTSTINFEEIINTGKILICNLSKGLLGEDTSELFGITILAKLQLASLKRARISQSARQPFYIYVDEFQNFATTSFVQMLSESRKYRVYLTMAEQSTSQQKDQQTVQIILANVGTVLCFRTANPADEKLLLPLFAPYVAEGEIAHLPSFNFYANLNAVLPQEPMSGETILLPEQGSANIQKIKANSRRQYSLRRNLKIKLTATENVATAPARKMVHGLDSTPTKAKAVLG